MLFCKGCFVVATQQSLKNLISAKVELRQELAPKETLYKGFYPKPHF